MADDLIQPDSHQLGWIGAGVMGRSMCARLMQEGFRVHLFTRTPSSATPLLDAGATWADSPREVAKRSDLIFSIVGYPEDVREVHLGEQGTLSGCTGGEVLVDMTTSQPELARQIADRAASMDVVSLDAPVSGGDIGAQNGTLSIMIGGEQEVVRRLDPCWKILGKTIVHQGPPGAGQHTKMVNQTLIATNMIGVCEALLYAHRAGLNLESVMQSVSQGAAGSWSLSNLGPRIMQNDFEPGFFVNHFIKDIGIALDQANRMGLSLPGLALAQQLYLAVQAQGGARMGTQALQLALSQLSNIDWAHRS